MAVFFVSLVLLLRTGLVLSGLLKGPVLHSFEKYGDEENFYYPLAQLMLWSIPLFMSIFFGIVQPWLSQRPTSPPLTAFLTVVVILITIWLYPHITTLAKQHPDIFLRYPRWYARLRRRTSRAERRRIAYRWLQLPYRLRLIYNGNDTAFFQWVDLVIIATIGADLEEDA